MAEEGGIDTHMATRIHTQPGERGIAGLQSVSGGTG